MKNNQLKLLITVLVIFSFTFLVSIRETKAIYREVKSTSINLSIINGTPYHVTFDVDGNDYDGWDVLPSHEVGTLPVPTKAHYNFLGWYTGPNGTGREINSNEVINADVRFYANWQKVVCIKASSGTLHGEDCDLSGSCISSGYTDNDTIYYGTIYGSVSNQTQPIAGNAYNCDVDNDDDYEEVVNGKNTERFYFIRETNDEKMVLVYYTNVDQNGIVDTGELLQNPQNPNEPYYQGEAYHYDDALTYLPTTSTWTNSDLVSFNGKNSRLINLTDIEAACGMMALNSSGYLHTCQYLMENTRFQSSIKGQDGIWVEKNGNTGYGLYTTTRTLASGIDTTSSGALNSTRPVIEVPVEAFEGYQYREKYEVSFNTNNGSSIASIYRYAYEPIGSLLALSPTRLNYTFVGWYIDSGLTVPVSDAMRITRNTTIYAKWTADILQYVFYIPGTCTFNGPAKNNNPNYITSASNDCISIVNPTGSNIDYTTTSPTGYNFIDTGIALFSNDNYQKEFELGFTINSYDYAAQSHTQSTFVNSKLDNSTLSYPGFVIRKLNATINLTEKFEGAEAYNAFTYTPGMSLRIVRRNNKIYYAQGNNALTELQDISNFAHQFNLNTWFGAYAMETNPAVDGTSSTVDRYLTATLSNMYIKLEAQPAHEVKFYHDNGSNDITTIEVEHGDTIGTHMPNNPTKNNYYFDGWYDGTTEITSLTEVIADINAHAKWVQSISNGTISPNPLDITVGNNSQITITGTDLEGVTYVSSNTNVATVNSTGLVSGVGVGTITITITGIKSGYTDTVTVNVTAPLRDVVFEPNNGGATTLVQVPSGSTLTSGQFPSNPSKTDYVFAGWYVSGDSTMLFDTTTPVTSNITVEALYNPSISFATVVPTSPNVLEIEEGSTGQITVTGPSGMESYSFTSNDDTIATVNASGEVYGVHEGNTTITITGDGSGLTKTVDVTILPPPTYYWVSFDTDGGSTINPIQVSAGGTLGVNMPNNPTKTGNTFMGWYNQTFTETRDANTVINAATTFYARWKPDNAEAEMNMVYYMTVQDAVNAAPAGTDAAHAPQTTIYLLKDVTVTQNYILNMFDDGNYNNTKKNIILEMQGHTFDKPSSVNGNFYITRSKGILELRNGTVTAYGSKGAVEAYGGGTLILDNMHIEAKGNRQGVYNDNGIIIIRNGTYVTAKAAVDSTNKRGTVQNVGGTLTILDSEIVSTTGIGLSISAGTVVIGEQDSVYDTSRITIRGATNGIYSTQNYSLYDGTIIGPSGGVVNDTTKITGKEPNFVPQTGSITIGSTTYETLYYTAQ